MGFGGGRRLLIHHDHRGPGAIDLDPRRLRIERNHPAFRVMEVTVCATALILQRRSHAEGRDSLPNRSRRAYVTSAPRDTS
jgi:hypothetical protein